MILIMMVFFSIQVPFSISLLSPFDMAPNAPTTTGITITYFIPHILAMSL